MAQNTFDATLDVDNQVKVNTFDWSHANNLTTQIGRVTPVFCDLVPAHSSFRVKPTFGLQFMPMVFPIQTRMKARIMFFKYPLRALWKDYRDFVGNFRQGLEEPYINLNSQDRIDKMASTGSLGDYLGLPTTQVGNFGSWNTYGRDSSYTKNTAYQQQTTPFPPLVGSTFTKTTVSSVSSGATYGTLLGTGSSSSYASQQVQIEVTIERNAAPPTIDLPFAVAIVYGGKVLAVSSRFTFGSSSTAITSIQMPSFSSTNFEFFVVYGGSNIQSYVGNGSTMLFSIERLRARVISSSGHIAAITTANSPWYSSGSSDKDKQIKLSAYAFRAYEGIYNSFIRDNRNNPYYINGEVQYNQWIPTYDGGVDNNVYELHYANWEKDFLTTSVQSPQQGTAPLVGLTTYAETKQTDAGPMEVIKTAIVDEDGKAYGLQFRSSDNSLDSVEYVELDNGVKMRQPRALIDVATSGISISDLRNVNAYQKFLELNMRKGYSYRDIIQGRFNVKVSYDDLLMPEFFGGFSRDIDMNAITQTVDQDLNNEGSYAKALGSQSGVAGVRGESGNAIECFCDEESIIMGILVVTPLPVYTQLLPKHFTYRGLLDHYQPEFNHIGFQPITYKEVCPIQAFNEKRDSLNDVFGYNRPWYEYVQKYDSAHGLFRTNLSNFLMHRVFDQRPELAKSFLVIDPEQVTDVFSVTETTDKIYGQIWFDATVKLPISRVAIPRLD